MRPGVGDRLPLGAVQAPLPEAHLPRARRGGARPDPVRAGDPLPPPTAGGGDFAFSSYLTRSGLAVPLVILLFGAVWMFPLITALVAGDIVASEDHNGTLKTVLTRSLERWQIFAGKALAAATYAVVAIIIAGTVAVIAGSIQSGFNSLQSLSGTIVSAPKALELVYVSLLVYLIPIADDRLHRAAALDDHAQQRRRRRRDADGLAAVPADRRSCPGWAALQPYLLSTQFNAWQGLPAHADRLGADHPRRVGLRAVRDAGAVRGVPRVPAPRRRRWLTQPWLRPRERVLVVDDDPPLRRMLERTLAAEGFEVTVAADGGAALIAAERARARRDRARRGDARARRASRSAGACAAKGLADADPDADRARRRPRPGRGARGRRRRLPGQAVRDRRS